MKKILLASLAMGFLLTGMANFAHADTIDIYQAGASNDVIPLDYFGKLEDYSGQPFIEWTFNVNTTGWATLTIIAEGVDSAPESATSPYGGPSRSAGEDDEVFLTGPGYNNKSLGFLTQQDFYSGTYFLNPGDGDLSSTTPKLTKITESKFNFTILQTGDYTIRVVMDTDAGDGAGWVNEIQTSTLTVVPEPTTLLLFGTGLAGLAAVGRRKRN